MKKIILSLMAGMVLFTSCDLLNNDPYDSFTKDNFFTSETNVEMYTNYFYAEWKGYGNNGSYGTFYFPTLNDNQAVTGITPWNFTTISATDDTWDASYEEVRRANILLENLDGVPMDEETRKYYNSLGRLYRAWQHFCVVRKFGDCYWVDHSLTTEDTDILYGPRQDRNFVMDKMLEDLNYAVENMGTKNADSRTAYNVYVAQAIKAQICLFEGTYAKYHKNDTERSKKYLAAAKAATEAIIKSGKFALTPGAEGYRANYNSLDLAGNTEMIMYKQYLESAKLRHATQDYCCGSTPTNGMSKSAFNAYLKKDGTLADKNDDHGVLGTEGYDAGKPVIYHLLEARDPRLAQQIDGYLCYVGNNRARYEGVPEQEGAAENTVTTGYGILKFDEPVTPSSLRQSTTGNVTDCPLFWYAEILLTHAEACAELGDEATAKNYLNELRNRVGMAPYTVAVNDPANTIGVSDLIWEIRRERRVELMFDNDDRYWSLIRWHQLDLLDTEKNPDQTKGAWIADSWPGASDVKRDANGYIDLTADYVRKFDEKHYLAPIPTSQSVVNPQIGQNPGW